MLSSGRNLLCWARQLQIPVGRGESPSETAYVSNNSAVFSHKQKLSIQSNLQRETSQSKIESK